MCVPSFVEIAPGVPESCLNTQTHASICIDIDIDKQWYYFQDEVMKGFMSVDRNSLTLSHDGR
jgi:hypothetical protein